MLTDTYLSAGSVKVRPDPVGYRSLLQVGATGAALVWGVLCCCAVHARDVYPE